MQNAFTQDLAALVLFSPNFYPNKPSSRILLWPWGKKIAQVLIGDYREWEPRNEGERQNWSWRTPTKAVFTMMGLVDLVDNMDLSTRSTPLLVLHSNFDQVVNVNKIIARYQEAGSPIKKRIEVNNTEDKNGHQLAGDILSPSTNTLVLSHIIDFLKPTLKLNAPQ